MNRLCEVCDSSEAAEQPQHVWSHASRTHAASAAVGGTI